MPVVVTLPFTLQNGQVADATQVMSNLNALVTGFLSAAAAGANSDITALLGLTTPISYLVGGSSAYIGATSTGSANAQVVAAFTPASYSLTSGKRALFTAGFTNTGATTFNLNSTGATAVRKSTPAGLAALTGGEIIAGNPVEAIFDGTFLVLLTNDASLAGPLTNLASATPDLGTIPSHNVNITGTTAITAFGSTASTTYPIYFLTFADALTLTYNATSLIIPGSINITTAAADTAVAMYLGSGNWKILSYTKRSGAGILGAPLKGIQAFTSGSGTYTPTPGATAALAFVTGGGGGSGGADTTGSYGGGGGGGATAIAFISSLAAVAYAVGAGGTAGADTGAGTGGTGGQSALGSITANGGLGGAGNAAAGSGAGGAGSSTTANATVTIPGSDGWTGFETLGGTGAGGGSFWGQGAPKTTLPLGGAGTAGVVPGSGASGAYANSSTNRAGAIGAAGLIVVIEF